MRIVATKAAAEAHYTAVALRERFAAIVSFQRHQPSYAPSQNVNSAASPVLPASQFGGLFCTFRIFRSFRTL